MPIRVSNVFLTYVNVCPCKFMCSACEQVSEEGRVHWDPVELQCSSLQAILCGCWKLKQGCLQGQKTLLTAEPSLLPPLIDFMRKPLNSLCGISAISVSFDLVIGE